jgi:hypothetical protein
VVPLETRSGGSYVLWFDNTGGLVTSVALANASTEPATVTVTVRDGSGTVIGTAEIELEPHGHTAFELPSDLPATAGRRGTVEFQAPASGQISVLGLRFSSGAFTTVPVIAK